MKSFLNKKFAALVPYTPGEQPKGMENLIKLNTNENPFPPGPMVLKALQEEAIRDLRLYPDPACTRLGAALGKIYGLKPSELFFGNGSDEVLAFCFHGFCEEGALFPDISYGFYSVFADMFSVPYTKIPLREDFSIRVEDYAGKKGTIFLANPNAPTGLALPLSDIESLLKQDPDRLVIVDEAYVDFGAQSARCLIEDYGNLLVVQTFSKSRQLAGARPAMAAGNEGLIRDLNTLKFSFNPYSVNRLALLAGEASMLDTTYFESCRQAVMENRAYTAKGLRELGFTVLESRANFLFAMPPKLLSARDYHRALRERAILVRHFNKERIDGFVRISIGAKEQMEAFLLATEEILKEKTACEI